MRPRLPSFLVLGGALAIALATTPALDASTYLDKQHGFSIKIAPDWTQTPTQPGEQTEVAKWKDDRKGDFSTLSIFRFVKAGTATESPDGSDSPEAPPVGPWGQPLPTDAKEYLEFQIKRISDVYKGGFTSLPEPRTLKYGKVEGEYYELEWESERRRGMGRAYCAGIAEKDGEEYLILYSSPLNQAKKLKRVARWSISSFRFRGEVADDDDDDPEKRGRALADDEDLIDPAKRAKIKSELVGSWKYFDTPHYIIIYNCDLNLARVIADRIEWIRTNAYEKVFPPIEPIKEAMVVRVCKEMDEYHHYGGPPGSAGYWYSAKDEFVLPDLAAKKKADRKTLGVLHHEGFHQYIYYALLKHDPPVWFNEGFAEYFYCARPAGRNRVRYEKKHDMRYSTFKNLIGRDSMVPVKDFIHMSHMQYMQGAQNNYTQGWAFATWMMRVTRNERYREVPKIFFQEMQKGYLEAGEKGGGPGFFPGMGRQNPIVEEALNKAFEGIDLDEMNKDFLKDAKRKM